MAAHFAANRVKLLGTGSRLPGPPVTNERLFETLTRTCGARTTRRAKTIAHKLGITARHLARDLHAPRSGTRNGVQAPALCRAALDNAMAEAQSTTVAYLIGHTSSPHTLLPPNIAWVADELEYTGPYLELRQACTGFANGLQVAAALLCANDLRGPGEIHRLDADLRRVRQGGAAFRARGVPAGERGADPAVAAGRLNLRS